MKNRLELRPHDFHEPSIWDDSNLDPRDQYAWCSIPSWRSETRALAPNNPEPGEVVWDREHIAPPASVLPSSREAGPLEEQPVRHSRT